MVEKGRELGRKKDQDWKGEKRRKGTEKKEENEDTSVKGDERIGELNLRSTKSAFHYPCSMTPN